jgi:16S rRNA (adenine1518-N6/adenine1519-N6)-dimethyltransferase
VNGHQARKRFGQNFLHDQHVIGRIVAAIHPLPGDHLVEIGPGLGALTGPLAALSPDLQVVEIDRDLVSRLRQQFPGLQVHEGDALELDYATLGNPIRLLGNLPYNISTPLLFHISRFVGIIQDAHFMLQKEVVDRMVSAPGTKIYGRLSVMLQYRWTMQQLFRVAPGSFHPVPKVESAIVRLRPHPPGFWRARSEEDFAELVSAAFSQRRKTIRNALGNLLNDAELVRADVDPGSRAETLGVDAYIRLSDRLTELRGAVPAC